MNTLGKTIRLLRHQKGWNQDDAAKRLKISVPAFSKIEAGVTDVNLSRLEEIAEIFDMSAAQLVSLTVAGDDSVQIDEMENCKKKLVDLEKQVISLQKKVIDLLEEIMRSKSSSDHPEFN